MTTNFNEIGNEEEEYDQFLVEEEEEPSDNDVSANPAISQTNQGKSTPSNGNLNALNSQNSQQQAQPNNQLHSFEEEDEEEDTREIQLQEVSAWRKQTQRQEQQQQTQQNQEITSAKSQNTNPNVTFNNNNNDDKFIEADDHQFNSDNIPDDESILREKFQQFMEEKKQKCVLYLDEGRVNLLPAPLRPPIQNIINTVKRLTARNPTGAPLSALQILAERLDEFLELQKHRTDRDYDLRCRDLLSIIYRNTIEAQRLSRQLRDAAAPRSLDEYENY